MKHRRQSDRKTKPCWPYCRSDHTESAVASLDSRRSEDLSLESARLSTASINARAGTFLRLPTATRHCSEKQNV